MIRVVYQHNMEVEMEILLDEGYQFGLGAFETIAVEENCPVFLEWHLERLREAIDFFGFSWKITEEEVWQQLRREPIVHGALKVIVSNRNVVFLTRENHYTQEQYQRGFRMEFSPVRRNETSPLVYYKTMNYGDCILEKRRAGTLGLDELIFLNMRGEISEGTTTNIFFGKNGKLYTPRKECGLLPGVMRRYVMSEMETEETVMIPEQLQKFDECFVTNSLVGIMPAASLAGYTFEKRETADWLRKKYLSQIVH